MLGKVKVRIMKNVSGAIIAGGVLELMKQSVPWSQTWIEREGFRGYKNAATGESYGVIETLMLASQGMTDEVVGTANEWRAAGYYPVLGGSPRAVVLKEGQTLEDLYDEDGNIIEGVGAVVYGSSAVAKYGTDEPYPTRAKAEYPNLDIPYTRLDEVLDKYFEEEGIDYAESEGSQSFYNPEDDEIRLPAK